MSITFGSVLTSLLWSLVAATATWLVLYPIRRRWLIGMLASVVLTGTAASIGALIGGIHEMLIPMHQWVAIVLLTVAAGAIATLAAAFSANRLAVDNRTLRTAITDLAAGRIPDHPGRALTAELEQLRTELDTTARALSSTRERERALESARRMLVTSISHDLRTPLAGLRALAEALEDGMADDPHVYYKQIATSANQLTGMVDDLFDLSRIQSGSFPHSSDQIALAELVSDCVAALVQLAHTHGVRLTGDAADRPTVLGNESELNRALTNLIANAIRHTPRDGAVTVAVTAEPSTNRAAITVADQCGGIPDTDLPHLFEVGFRGETARTPQPDQRLRAGLGLAIARGIVEAHAGTIDVYNTADGCTFRLLLPATSEHQQGKTART